MSVKVVPMTPAEVIDRYTIAVLKHLHAPPDRRAELKKPVIYYARGIDFGHPGLYPLIAQLRDLNAAIWQTEAAIRDGQEGQYDLADIGRLALKVRDLNIRRCECKDAITTLLGEGFPDAKFAYGPVRPKS